MVGEGRRKIQGNRPATHRAPKGNSGGGGGGGKSGDGCAVTAVALAGGVVAALGGAAYGAIEAVKAVL